MKEENSVQSIFSAKRQLNFNCSACRVVYKEYSLVVYNQSQIVYELVYPTSPADTPVTFSPQSGDRWF